MGAVSCDHTWSWPDSPYVRELGLGVAALLYAELGYAVLPLEPGSKRPHYMLGPSGGVQWASSHPGRIASWWRADPAANIGVACGSASGLAVVDLDVKTVSGPAHFFRFLSQPPFQQDGVIALPFPDPAVAARTPSGGWHLWLRVPAGWSVPDRPGILPGVDVKGDGGYVVAAPSGIMTHVSGRDGEHGGIVGVPYDWVLGCPCSAPGWPDWMAGWLRDAPRTQGGTGSGAGMTVDLEKASAEGFAAGSRNVSMYRTACGLFRKYGTSDAGVAAVARRCWAIWDAGDKSGGFDWHEVLVTIESARKFIAAQEEAERAAAAGFAPWADRHGA